MNYFKIKRVSNSSLSYINPDQDGSANKYKQYIDGVLPRESSASLELGDLVHKYMLEPENFNVLEMNKPSESIVSIVDYVIESVHQDNLDSSGGDLSKFDAMITEGADMIKYGQNWKDATIVNKVVTMGQEYFKFVLTSKDKQIIDTSTAYRLQECVISLQAHKGAQKLLNDNDDKAVKAFNELSINWEKEIDGYTHKCKSKIDRLIINTEKKTFTVVDLKTLSKHISKYPKSFSYWHTGRQVAFYEDAAKAWLNENGYINYKPSKNHYIVAVMTTDPYLTRVFSVAHEHIFAGRTEYYSLLDRVRFHTESNDWVFEMEYQQGKLAWEIPFENIEI